jgi:hypothetical protein
MSIASDLINDARTFSSETLSAAISEMGAAMAVLDGLGNNTHLGGPPPLTISPPEPGDPGDVPVYSGIHLEPGTFTTVAPLLQSVPSLVLPADPALPPADLSFTDPIQPSGEPDAALLNDVPSLSALPTFPTRPDLETEIQGIAKPDLVAISIPDAPTYVAPEFTGVRPVFDSTRPTDLDQTLSDQYSTINPIMRDAVTTQLDAFLTEHFPNFAAGMAAIETRLATYLAGGSALTPAIEDAIYNRTLDKTNADAKRAMQEALGKAARAGLTMFTPTLSSQLQDLDQDRRNNNARAATDIAVEQAKLEQANLQFAVTQSTNLRQLAISSAMSFYSGLIQINGQAVEYARSIVDAIVKTYDIAAKIAETQARIYEADGAIYRAKLEGALAVIQVYEQQIKGELAKSQVNHELVEVYRARLQAVQTEADVYRAAVDAVVAQAGLERIKVELYKARVEGYGAQVNAFTARWQGYGEAVRGQAARMQVNTEHSRAYSARAEAYSAVVRGKATAIESTTNTNRQLIETFKAQVEAFTALEHSKVESVHIDVEVFDAQIKSFIAKATAIAEHAKAEVSNYEVRLRGLIATADLYMDAQRETNRLDTARLTGMAQVATSAGQIYSGIAQAAMSGMNTLAAEVVSASE